MIKIITAHNIANHAELMEKVWRFRHVQFVERLGWRGLASGDGREIDQFDTNDAIHLVVEKNDAVIGYSRLLRTSGPHLLSDIYPEIMGGRAWPRHDAIYEWTRCISDANAGRLGNVQASHMLITGVLEFCLAAGISGLVVETHPKLVAWMRETGYEVEVLQEPQVLNGVPVVPVHIGMTRAALDRHHAMFGIGGSVLDIDPGLPNPVTRRDILRGFSGLAKAPDGVRHHPGELDFEIVRET